jgi:hypothetical protein
MTRQELKDQLTQICKEYVEENGGDVHEIIFSVGIYPDHESPQLKVIRYTSFNPNHIIA